MDADKLASQLYAALLEVMRERTGRGLLAALGDLQGRVPYDKAAPKTREIFTALADNLTRVQKAE